MECKQRPFMGFAFVYRYILHDTLPFTLLSTQNHQYSAQTQPFLHFFGLYSGNKSILYTPIYRIIIITNCSENELIGLGKNLHIREERGFREEQEEFHPPEEIRIPPQKKFTPPDKKCFIRKENRRTSRHAEELRVNRAEH